MWPGRNLLAAGRCGHCGRQEDEEEPHGYAPVPPIADEAVAGSVVQAVDRRVIHRHLVELFLDRGGRDGQRAVGRHHHRLAAVVPRCELSLVSEPPGLGIRRDAPSGALRCRSTVVIGRWCRGAW